MKSIYCIFLASVLAVVTSCKRSSNSEADNLLDDVRHQVVGEWYFDADYGGDPAFNFTLVVEEDGQYRFSGVFRHDQEAGEIEKLSSSGQWIVSYADDSREEAVFTMKGEEEAQVYGINVDEDHLKLSSREEYKVIFDAGPFRRIKAVPNKTQHHKSDRAGGSEA